MFRLKNEHLTKAELANSLLLAFATYGTWSDKALDNKNILGEALGFLFRESPHETEEPLDVSFSSANAYIGIIKKRLSRTEISIPHAVEPIFDHVLWNFFDLHQQRSIHFTTALTIANALCGNATKATFYAFHETLDFETLKSIATVLEPSATQVKINLGHILEMEKEKDEIALKEEQEKEKARQQDIIERLEQRHDEAKKLAQEEKKAEEAERALLIQKEKERLHKMIDNLSPIKKATPSSKRKRVKSKKMMAFTLPKGFTLSTFLNDTENNDTPETSIAETPNNDPDVSQHNTFVTTEGEEESIQDSFFSIHDETGDNILNTLSTSSTTKYVRERHPSLSLSFQLENAEEEAEENHDTPSPQQKVSPLACNEEDAISESESVESTQSGRNADLSDNGSSPSVTPVSEPETHLELDPIENHNAQPEQNALLPINPPPINMVAPKKPAALIAPQPLPEILKGVVYPMPVATPKPAPVVDEAAAKLAALRDCLDDLMWWNGKTSYKFFFGGTKTTVGNLTLRVPHHNTVFREVMTNPNPYAAINALVDIAKKQIPSAENKFRPGTRFFGCFQVRQEPMIDLMLMVAKLDTMSLLEVKAALEKIRGNTPWEPIAHNLAAAQIAPKNR